MQKTLSVVGNSLALIIDKPILELLGIGPRTLLDLRMDAGRLIIAPVAQKPESVIAPPPEVPAPSNEPDRAGMAQDAFVYLAERCAMGNEHVARLHHAVSSVRDYMRWAVSDARHDPDDDELATMRRLHECALQNKAGKSWTAAIEAALATYPKRSS